MVEALRSNPALVQAPSFSDPFTSEHLRYEPLRPRPIEPKLIDWVDETDKAETAHVDLIMERVKAGQKAQDRIHTEMATELQERQSYQSQETLWGALSNIGSLIQSAFSIVTGIGLIATANPWGVGAGTSMVLGGVGSLSSVAMKNAGFDEKTVGAIALVSTGLSLVGGGISGVTGVVGAPGNGSALVAATLGVMTGAGHIGQALSKSAINALDGKLIEHRGALDLMDAHANKAQEEVSFAAKHVQLLSRRAARMLEEETQVKLNILRGW